VRTVPLAELSDADWPRVRGLDLRHAKALATKEDDLPPILVSSRSLQIIDGMHRLRAAELRGQRYVGVRFVDVGPDGAFPARGASQSHARNPFDRRRPPGQSPSDLVRPHRSGGYRRGHPHSPRRPTTTPAGRRPPWPRRPYPPFATTHGRRHAGEIIAADPNTPLRDVARAAGISVAAAHDVQLRLRRGDDGVPVGRWPHRLAADLDCRSTVEVLVVPVIQSPRLTWCDAGGWRSA